MSKKAIIIAAAALILGIAGTAGFFMMRPSPASQAQAPAPVPGIVNMETFLVNINDPTGDRYAKLNVRLTVVPEAVATEVNDDPVLQARMRDRVLTLVTSKTLQDLIGPIGKEGLRREIKAHLEPLLDKGQIQDVLFSEFVVQ